MRANTTTKQISHTLYKTKNSKININVRKRHHNSINGHHIYEARISLIPTPIDTVVNFYLTILFSAFIIAQNSPYIAGSYIKLTIDILYIALEGETWITYSDFEITQMFRLKGQNHYTQDRAT